MAALVFPFKVSNSKQQTANKSHIPQPTNLQILTKIQTESDKIQKLIIQTADGIKKQIRAKTSITTTYVNPILKDNSTYQTNPVLIAGSLYHFNIAGLINDLIVFHPTLSHYYINFSSIKGTTNNTRAFDINLDTNLNDIDNVVEFTADIMYSNTPIIAYVKGYDVDENVIFETTLGSSINYSVQ